MYGEKSFYRDYENLLIKNDELSKENRNLKYTQLLLEKQNNNLRKIEEQLKNKVKELEEEHQNLLKEKDFEIARLKALLNMDGLNHGIPTSQTPINKKKVIPNTREKSDKPKGGQKGHPKHKLEKFKDDEITERCEHSMEKCPCCNSGAIKKTGEIKEKDELDYKIVVTKKRHLFPEYECEECGKKFHEEIPNNLKEENQYGPIDLSEGYIAKLQKRASDKLSNFMEEMKTEIIKQALLHWDDTVIMINTKRSCLRFYGTEKLAMYTAHSQKDKNGLDEDGILNVLAKETVVVHDHNKVNYNEDYYFRNAECNVHLIRDLKKVIENLNHTWAKKLIELITKMNKKRKWLIKKGKEEFSQEELKKFEDKFEKIMIEANTQNEEEKQKYYVDKEATLILRILDYKNEYFLWIYDFEVPFENNLSERGLRGAKSKQKASGQFWSVESASWYATIRTYIETCNRNNVNIYNALVMLSLGKPYTLKEILSGELD